MMSPSTKQDLAELQVMTVTQLRKRYGELFGEEPRSGNRQWLYRRCAWRIQALAEGNLEERMQRIRERAFALANDADIRMMPPKPPKSNPGSISIVTKVDIRPDDRLPVPGTVLIRDFKGTRHIVTVLPDGFDYRNKVYKSLSGVAHAISGAHWNGFHFFRESLNYAKQEAENRGEV